MLNSAYLDNGHSQPFSVMATNPPVASNAANSGISILQGPTAQALTPVVSHCGPFSMVLGATQASNGQTYLWSGASGVLGTASSLSISPTATTTYYFQTTLTADGCTLYDTTTVVIDPLVNPGLPDTLIAVCPATSLSIGGAPVANCTYAWTDGHGFTSSLVSPTVSNTTTDVYRLRITDSLTHCATSASVQVTAKQAPPQGLCLVTVDSATSHNLLVWEKLDKAATDSFRICRETSTNVYSVIAVVPRNSLSEYEDSAANPAITGYRYKITTVDTCGNEVC